MGLVEHHPAVSARGAEADMITLEDRDVETRVPLFQKIGCNEARIAASHANDVRGFGGV